MYTERERERERYICMYIVHVPARCMHLRAFACSHEYETASDGGTFRQTGRRVRASCAEALLHSCMVVTVISTTYSLTQHKTSMIIQLHM